MSLAIASGLCSACKKAQRSSAADSVAPVRAKVQTAIVGTDKYSDRIEALGTVLALDPIDYFEVVDAQRTELDANQQAVRLELARHLAAISLIRALGGDW